MVFLQKALSLIWRHKLIALLVLAAVDMGESAGRVGAYVAPRSLTFPHLLDISYEVSRMFFIRGTPTNFLVDREGRIRGGGVGYRDWSSAGAHQLIESLLKEGADRGPRER